jgi:hypothetical protein
MIKVVVEIYQKNLRFSSYVRLQNNPEVRRVPGKDLSLLIKFFPHQRRSLGLCSCIYAGEANTDVRFLGRVLFECRNGTSRRTSGQEGNRSSTCESLTWYHVREYANQQNSECGVTRKENMGFI